MLTAQTIKNQHSDISPFLHGDLGLVASHCHIPAEALLGSLVYACDDAGSHGGYPLQPLKEAMKTAVNISHLNEIRKNLNRVMRHLHLLDSVHADSTDT